jgi:hypothetical protein
VIERLQAALSLLILLAAVLFDAVFIPTSSVCNMAQSLSSQPGEASAPALLPGLCTSTKVASRAAAFDFTPIRRRIEGFMTKPERWNAEAEKILPQIFTGILIAGAMLAAFLLLASTWTWPVP